MTLANWQTIELPCSLKIKSILEDIHDEYYATRSSVILSQAVEHERTVYPGGIVAKDLNKDVRGQTREVLEEIDRLLAKCGSSKSKDTPVSHLGDGKYPPGADERGVDRLGRQDQSPGARVRRSQAR